MISWGKATDGQLGLGGIEEPYICKPRWNKHVGRHDILGMGCGLKHTVVLLEDGKVLSCGSNEKGQLGQDERATRPGSIATLASTDIRQLSCGNYHSLALDVSGRVQAWGDSTYGQLGLGDTSNQVLPRIVDGLKESTIVQIACGGNYCMALAQDGHIFSWGQNDHNQLGLANSQPLISSPRCISALEAIPVVQVCAGRGHSIVVTRGGSVFSWGRNNFGQLGIGSTKESEVPAQMPLDDIGKDNVRHAACGEEHTVLLTQNGCVFTCGSSNYGQLGHGSTTNLETPTLVKALVGKEMCQVSCGRMHTVVVESGTGDIYSFGLASNGQLGSGERKNLLEPTLIQLGEPPATNIGPPDVGSDPSSEGDESTKFKYSLRRVFAGGDQTFASVRLVEVDKDDGEESNKTTPTSKVTPTSSEVKYPIDLRILVHTEMPYFLDRGLIDRLDLDRMNRLDMEECIRILEIIFSNPACLNGSLVMKGYRCCTEDRQDIDVVNALEIFTMIRQRLRPDTMESTRRMIMDMIMQVPMNNHACDSNLELKLINELFPAMPHKPCGVEGLRIFYMLPAYMLAPARKDLIQVYLKALLNLNDDYILTLLKWFFNGSVDYTNLFLISFRKLLYKPFLRLKDDSSKHCDASIKEDQKLLKLALRFFRLLYEMNLKKNEPIKYEQWHFKYLSVIVNLKQDYLDWIEKKSGVIIMCEYAFLLDAKAKSFLMWLESRVNQEMAVGAAYRQNILGFFTGQNVPDMNPDSFVLEVNRDNLVDSTVKKLLAADTENLKKPLQVQFVGEEGKDEGGMGKEFFMLLSQQILNPDFGMFVEDEESHLLWFREGEIFYERLDYFIIIGMLCGLAIYNSIAVDLPFPLILFKKLLNRPPNFDDFKELFPITGRSLQSLLDYEGDDFEKHFNLNHTITREVFGEVKVKDLIENGSQVAVTKENRNNYIYEYMRYISISSIEEQFMAFKTGFLKVCGGKVLNLLHPRDLMLLVVGTQVKDWTEFKKHMKYGNGYTEKDESILHFWDIFNNFSQEEKTKFLVFLTGTDRIPIKGFERMEVIIQKMDGGEDYERLPVAHTCFNVLDLPPYPTKTKMREKLYQAMTMTSGFGII